MTDGPPVVVPVGLPGRARCPADPAGLSAHGHPAAARRGSLPGTGRGKLGDGAAALVGLSRQDPGKAAENEHESGDTASRTPRTSRGRSMPWVQAAGLRTDVAGDGAGARLASRRADRPAGSVRQASRSSDKTGLGPAEPPHNAGIAYEYYSLPTVGCQRSARGACKEGARNAKMQGLRVGILEHGGDDGTPSS